MYSPVSQSGYPQAGILHALDARAKLVGALVLVVALVTTPSEVVARYLYFGVAVFGVLGFSRMRLGHVLRQSAVVLPLVLLVMVAGLLGGSAGEAVFTRLWALAWKAWLGILIALWLTAVTPFPDLLDGLARLRLPSVVVLLTGFIYRYLFVLAGEVLRMRRAMQARGFRLRRLGQAREIGHLAGTLFLRSHERAERSYLAMLARGYGDGPHRPTRRPLTALDYAFVAVAVVLAAAIRILPT